MLKKNQAALDPKAYLRSHGDPGSVWIQDLKGDNLFSFHEVTGVAVNKESIRELASSTGRRRWR